MRGAEQYPAPVARLLCGANAKRQTWPRPRTFVAPRTAFCGTHTRTATILKRYCTSARGGTRERPEPRSGGQAGADASRRVLRSGAELPATSGSRAPSAAICSPKPRWRRPRAPGSVTLSAPVSSIHLYHTDKLRAQLTRGAHGRTLVD